MNKYVYLVMYTWRHKWIIYLILLDCSKLRYIIELPRLNQTNKHSQPSGRHVYALQTYVFIVLMLKQNNIHETITFNLF